VAKYLGDRVKDWAILNEPNVHALFGIVDANAVASGGNSHNH
jgi:beta-glucosidase/6-phospho-beta-glucosidase/beta-galactosidase